MIKAFFIPVILFMSCTAHAITLQQGDVATLEFSNISTYSSFLSAPDSGNIKVNSPSYFASGLTLKLELFANTFSDPAFETFYISDQPGYLSLDSYGSWGYRNIDPAPWNDLQGAVRFTVLDGSIDLNLFEIDVTLNGTDYVEQYNNFQVQSVPIVPAVYLFVSGLLFMMPAGSFLRKHARHST